MTKNTESFRIPIEAVVFVLMVTICASTSNSPAQTRLPRRPDPQTQLLDNYRRYPDRYIRISNETWKYSEGSRSALHSFTVKNSAGVAYSAIEIRLNYLDSNGKALVSRTLKIPGNLAAYEVRKIKEMKVRDVPAGSDQVILTVTKAMIYP